MLTLIIYGTVIAGGFTLLLWLPNAVLDFAADKLAEEYAYGDLPIVPQELRPARNMVEGGVSERTRGRAGNDQDIARHDRETSR
jgi:hypothetical protein